jgi:hypothetical protein
VRVLAVLSLCACVAAAEPYVRWIDKTGGVQRREVDEVLAESASSLKLRLSGGEEFELALRSLLELVRERDSVAEERDLLRARQSALWGGELDEARPVLDRLAREGSKAWIRRDAACARAVLAAWAGEKDALERIEGTLKSHPDSRFTANLHVARARVQLRGAKSADKIFQTGEETFQEIGTAGGPCLVQQSVFRHATEHVLEKKIMEYSFFMNIIHGRLDGEVKDAKDVATHLVAESTRAWITLVRERILAAEIEALGRKPFGPQTRVERVRGACAFLLPELRADVHLCLGDLHERCGEPEKARAEFAAALKAAPDARRQRIARERADRQARKTPPR